MPNKVLSDASPQTRGARIRAVPAVTRAVAILRLLGRSQQPMGVNAIAQTLELVPSTCLHILRALVHERLVSVDSQTKLYGLGVGLLPLARSVVQGNNFASAVQASLDRISDTWNVTAIGVDVADAEHMVVLALSKSQQPFRLYVDVGSRFPSLVSATGRLVAAFGGQDWATLAQRFANVRWQRKVEFETWKQEVMLARERGFSLDEGAYINGVTIVAVPILNHRGRITHTIVTAHMQNRLTKTELASLVKFMQTEANLVADRILI
jgi:DNA-binding IclR family transcriptional regulator